MRRLEINIIMLLSAMLLLSGCGKEEEYYEIPNSEVVEVTSEDPEQPKEAEQQQDETEQQPNHEAIYAPVLEKYKTAITEKWEYEALEAAKLDINLCYIESLKDFGYMYEDIDSDGNVELLLGRISDIEEEKALIWDLYTIRDGVPKLVCVTTERDFYYLNIDGSISNEGWGSEFETLYARCKIGGDGELEFTECVFTEPIGELDAENVEAAFYYGTGNDAVFNTDKCSRIPSDEFDEKSGKMTSGHRKINYVPFA